MAARTDPILLTPGPLTTSPETKAAMLRDWGSRDADFIALNARVRAHIVEIAGCANATGGGASHVCVPIQGSGTFAVEAAVGTFVPRDGKLLVLVNGAYGRRIARMCAVMGRAHATLETPEDTPNDQAALETALAADTAITHVAAIHCETTSGILNPIEEIAAIVARHDRGLIIDAMSAFGAIELDARETPYDVLLASANKCLEGVPGIGFAVIRTDVLAAAEGNAPSLSLDLHDQWRAMEGNGQWRFTPPTHVLAALGQALDEHAAEGGVAARGARYRRNCDVLVTGMRALGFETLLPDALQAPIIVTFHTPADPRYDFKTFYDHLHRRGFAIYPGKLTDADSFRIGCIGRVYEDDMRGVLGAIEEALGAMGVETCAPAKAA